MALSRSCAVLVALVAGLTLASCTGGSGQPTPSPSSDTAGAPTASAPSGVTSVTPTHCPAATVVVHDANELTSALAAARPGQSIGLADGTYDGEFVASVSGTAARPIYLCGGVGAVLDGGTTKTGYVFHLDHVSYWRIIGFTVRNGQKGVVTDATQHSVIGSLTISDIGEEGIHLRTGSSDNIIDFTTIMRTGLHRDKFGEGVYVGSAKSNWCTYTNCQPDPSDRNMIVRNHISQTAAESVDIKEGTVGGVLADNSFDGSDLSGADSWVDVKGNGWLVAGNTGTTSPADGFQTHVIVPGDGRDNVFTKNIANVDGPGYGFHFSPVGINSLRCDNTVAGAGNGLSNMPCH